ncbi:Hsp70 family protein [Klebsiella pneumoniae]|nr:Hsp70 family protein [Klebsiella pneumoniae]
MVGGSTRVPLVRERVGKFFGRTPLTSIDPDLKLSPSARRSRPISWWATKPDSELLLLDVIPLSLGTRAMGGLVEKVIRVIPHSGGPGAGVYHLQDGQTAMSIHVMQGEREHGRVAVRWRCFALRGIRRCRRAEHIFALPSQVDADGLLKRYGDGKNRPAWKPPSGETVLRSDRWRNRHHD